MSIDYHDRFVAITSLTDLHNMAIGATGFCEVPRSGNSRPAASILKIQQKTRSMTEIRVFGQSMDGGAGIV